MSGTFQVKLKPPPHPDPNLEGTWPGLNPSSKPLIGTFQVKAFSRFSLEEVGAIDWPVSRDTVQPQCAFPILEYIEMAKGDVGPSLPRTTPGGGHQVAQGVHAHGFAMTTGHPWLTRDHVRPSIEEHEVHMHVHVLVHIPVSNANISRCHMIPAHVYNPINAPCRLFSTRVR